MAVELLTGGRTHADDFYSRKTGKLFSADLLLDTSEGRVAFQMEFPKKEAENTKEKCKHGNGIEKKEVDYHGKIAGDKGTGGIHGKGCEQFTEGLMKYLDTAAKLYRYPFSDTLLIHAQRPDATACVSLEAWNQRMGRWVNRGAKGIAPIDDTGPRRQLLLCI